MQDDDIIKDDDEVVDDDLVIPKIPLIDGDDDLLDGEGVVSADALAEDEEGLDVDDKFDDENLI